MKRFTSVVMLCMLGVLMCLPQTAFAGKDQSLDEIRAVSCSALKGTGNLGVEFYFTFVPCYEEAGNNKLMLYIASSSNGFATIEVIGKGYQKVVKVAANDIVPVELGPGFGQAFSKSTNGSIPPEQVYAQAAIHIKATVPIVVYGVTRFNYTSDSFMALPVQALGKEYVVASMADMTWMYGGYSLPSETSIVAAYDNTAVEFTLGGPSVTVSGGGMRPGQTKRFNMNKGDVWVIGNDANSKEGDVSGSYIKATKPVGVISGNQCANVPTVSPWCDFISEMELPTNTWGRFLQVPKYASRTYGYFMKVFAKEPNTKVFYNGSYWKTIQTVGGQEGRGWIYQRVDGSGNNVLSLSADKPISATVFNTGQSDDNVSTDPFQMNVMPIEQYQKNVMFCTPGSKGGIGFTRNFLGVIFEIDTLTGGMPKDLQFGVSVNGKMTWRALSAVFGASFSTKDVFQQAVGGKKYAFKECVLPSDNVYGMRCSKSFMCYSYGGSDYDSYGHPTSGALAVVLPDTTAPIVTYEVDCDGSVGVKTKALVHEMPNDDSIRSNLSTITMDPDSSYNYTLDYDPFVAGTTRDTKWTMRVDNPDVDAHALIVFTDRAGNQSCAEVNYRAQNITITPKVVDFGLKRKGTVDTRDITVKNQGTSKVEVTKLQFKNGGVGVFKFIPDLTLPFDMNSGEERKFTVQYTATNDGDISDSIGVGNDCVFNYRTLVRAKTGEPVINVSDINFGSVVIGDSPTKDFTISNTGNVQLTISGQSGVVPASPSVYTVTDNSINNISASNPLLIGVSGTGQDTKSYTVRFAPLAEASYDATITFMSDATTIDSVCVIRGIGIKPGLSANIVDFKRCRISENGNSGYTGPYTKDFSTIATGAPAKIVLTNSGSADVTISDAVPSGNVASFSAIDLSHYKGLTIPAKSADTINISYIPAVAQYDTLRINFKNNANSGTMFEAVGTGVIPRITIDDVPFGQVDITVPSPLSQKQFRIKNLGAQDWPFYDVAKITDLVDPAASSPEDIGISGKSDIGAQRMSYDKLTLGLPLTLNPGESSNAFEAYYQPKDRGVNASKLQTVSDAQTQPVSNWTGSAVGGVLNFDMRPVSASICVGSTIDMDIMIYNTSTIDMTGIAFKWKSTPAPTDLDLPIVPANFMIAAGDSAKVRVSFHPKAPLNQTTYVMTADATPGAPVISKDVNITVTGEYYPSSLSLPASINEVTKPTKDGSTQFFKVPATLGAALDAGNVLGLKASISFDPKALFARRAVTGSSNALVTLNPTGAAKGWTVTSSAIKPNGNLETIYIEMSGPTPLNGGASKELFNIEFQMLLAPVDIVINNNGVINLDLTDVKAYRDQAMQVENSCVAIAPTGGKITQQPVCAFNVTQIQTSGVTFGMKTATPNPVTESGTKIEFGVGYDAPTRIDVINTSGEVVATLINETLKANYYTLNFFPTNLASGSYTVRMISSSNTFSQQVQIVK